MPTKHVLAILALMRAERMALQAGRLGVWVLLRRARARLERTLSKRERSMLNEETERGPFYAQLAAMAA